MTESFLSVNYRLSPDSVDPRNRPPRPSGYPGRTMSKKTNKRKIKARRKKANHGKKPNAGR